MALIDWRISGMVSPWFFLMAHHLEKYNPPAYL